jgi:hypothetical protein
MRTLLALALIASTLGGCWGNNRRWDRRDDRSWEDRERRNDPDADCRSGRGRVNVDRWSDIVEEFLHQTFRRRGAFRDAKQRLLGELQEVRGRACDWEARDLERLIDRVRDYNFRDAVD